MPSSSFSSEFKETVSLSLPLVGSWLIYSLSGFIGTAMVARLGENALAASVLVTTIWIAVSVFFFGIFNSVSVLVSHQFGAKRYDQISIIVGQALLLTGLVSIPLMLIIAFIPFLLRSYVQDITVLNLAIQYAHALVWSAPGVLFLVTMEHFLNGIGRTQLSLWISLLEVPFEIFLIYIFVFGKWGVPAFGIAGVGYGFAASFTLTSILLFIYLYNKSSFQCFNIFKNILTIDRYYLREIIRIGLPVGIMYLIEVLTLSFATFLIARFGTVVLAAHQIVVQYLTLTVNAAFAIAQAVSIRIGQNRGKGNEIGIRNASYVGLVLALTCFSIISVIYVIEPQLFLRIDLNLYDPHNQLLIKETITLFSILALYQVLDSLRIIAAGALRGLKDTRFSMYTSFVSFWIIGLGSAFTFGFIFHGKGPGIWFGLTLGTACGAFILLFRLHCMLNHVTMIQSDH